MREKESCCAERPAPELALFPFHCWSITAPQPLSLLFPFHCWSITQPQALFLSRFTVGGQASLPWSLVVYARYTHPGIPTSLPFVGSLPAPACWCMSGTEHVYTASCAGITLLVRMLEREGPDAQKDTFPLLRINRLPSGKRA